MSRSVFLNCAVNDTVVKIMMINSFEILISIKKRKLSNFHHQLQPLIVPAFVRTKLYMLFCSLKHHIIIISCYSSSSFMKVSSHLKCLEVLNWKMMMMKSRTKNAKLWIIVGMCVAKEPVTKHFLEVLHHLEVFILFIYVAWRLKTNTYRTKPQYYWNELHF